MQIRHLLQAERIFRSNATLEEVLAQATALTARLNASTAVATVTMQSLLPQDLNTSNSILSSTITALQDSMITGFNTTMDEPQEVYQPGVVLPQPFYFAYYLHVQVIVDIFNNLLNSNNGEGWRSLQTVCGWHITNLCIYFTLKALPISWTYKHLSLYWTALAFNIHSDL